MDVLEIYKNSIEIKEEFLSKEKCEELLYKSKDGNIDARNELTKNFLLFVINRVTRFKKIYFLPNIETIPIEDLIQDINLFVLENIDKWNPQRGCFTTAMGFWIDRQLLGIFNDRYFTGYNDIRIPVRTREQCGKLEKVDPNRSFSPKMISDYLKIKSYRGLELFNARKCIKVRYIGDKDLSDKKELKDTDIDLNKQFKYLLPKTRQMIEMKYGLNGYKKQYSYTEIGKTFNLNELTIKDRILKAFYNFRNHTSRRDWQ